MRPSSSATLSDWLYSRNSSPSSMPASASPTSFSTRLESIPVRSKNRSLVTARLLIGGSRLRYRGDYSRNMVAAGREGKTTGSFLDSLAAQRLPGTPCKDPKFVVPAKAGIYGSAARVSDGWVPAFAGTTRLEACDGLPQSVASRRGRPELWLPRALV